MPIQIKCLVDRYPPAGFCIYCGISDTVLTDEHVIPFSLAGRIVLPKSSCKPCAEITSKFEMHIAREMFGKFRQVQSYPTRNPKQRPATVKFRSLESGEFTGIHDVPIDEFPTAMSMPVFGVARLLSPASEPQPLYMASFLQDREKARALAAKVGADIEMVPPYGLNEFSRLLAKIAHSAFWGEVLRGRYPGFSKETWDLLLPTFILTGEGQLFDLIGSPAQWDAPRPDQHYKLKFGEQILLNKFGDEWVQNEQPEFNAKLVSIRLFEFLGAPEYDVVVARPKRDADA
jgi:hypothetical protein